MKGLKSPRKKVARSKKTGGVRYEFLKAVGAEARGVGADAVLADFGEEELADPGGDDEESTEVHIDDDIEDVMWERDL